MPQRLLAISTALKGFVSTKSLCVPCSRVQLWVTSQPLPFDWSWSQFILVFWIFYYWPLLMSKLFSPCTFMSLILTNHPWAVKGKNQTRWHLLLRCFNSMVKFRAPGAQLKRNNTSRSSRWQTCFFALLNSLLSSFVNNPCWWIVSFLASSTNISLKITQLKTTNIKN